jgi:hypothetical protein
MLQQVVMWFGGRGVDDAVRRERRGAGGLLESWEAGTLVPPEGTATPLKDAPCWIHQVTLDWKVFTQRALGIKQSQTHQLKGQLKLRSLNQTTLFPWLQCDSIHTQVGRLQKNRNLIKSVQNGNAAC